MVSARTPLSPAFVAERGAVLAPLLRLHAPLTRLPLVPELRVFAAVDELPLWLALDARGLGKSAPFFAVAWPGAQALARAIFDGVVDVRGRVVIDLGCGSGLAAVAAKACGAARVIATDVDEDALVCAALVAADNGVDVEVALADAVDGDVCADVDVVLAGDVVYNQAVGAAFARALAALAQQQKTVLVADSGRPFFDPGPLTLISERDVDVPVAVEGKGARRVRLYCTQQPTGSGRGGGGGGAPGKST